MRRYTTKTPAGTQFPTCEIKFTTDDTRGKMISKSSSPEPPPRGNRTPAVRTDWTVVHLWDLFHWLRPVVLAELHNLGHHAAAHARQRYFLGLATWPCEQRTYEMGHVRVNNRPQQHAFQLCGGTASFSLQNKTDLRRKKNIQTKQPQQQ